MLLEKNVLVFGPSMEASQLKRRNLSQKLCANTKIFLLQIMKFFSRSDDAREFLKVQPKLTLLRRMV